MALKDLRTIKDSEVSDKRIHQLRVRPNERSSYGAPGLTGKELQAKYDEYAELLRQRFNDIVEAIKASLDNADENGSQIAEEIMVVVNGFSVPRRTNTLANAIKDMIERILGAEAVADEAKACAESAEGAAQNAVIIANIAESRANSAGNLAYGANETASDAKKTANEAKSKAVNAEENATAAVESADYARTVAEEAIVVARTAEGIADQAIGISKGANQAEVFDTEEEMFEWIGDNHSALGHTVTPTTKLIVAADTELITVTNTDGYNGVEVGDEIPPNTCFLNIAFTDGTILDESYTSAPFNVEKDESTGRTYANFELYLSYYDVVGKTIKSVRAEFGLLGPYAGARTIRKNLTYRTYDEPKTINDLIIWHPYEIYDKPIGTNLLIRDLGVPDYWWDGAQAQQLETQKVDLSEYVKAEEIGDIDAALEDIDAMLDELIIPNGDEVAY